jgi:putative transposase
LDKTGIILDFIRTHSRSPPGTKVADIKPFYQGAKVTAIGAISINKVLGLMTMNDSMDGRALTVFIDKFLSPELGKVSVVVMDNLPAHKLASIVPLIKAYGASVICLSPYCLNFNPIELWWSQLKFFLRSFAPTTTSMIDKIIAVALKLMNPKHLRNWES